ncbi:amino acid permease [Sandaracinobacteroides hominis]|uniref:amino acid permease n=1 Tax=Sandaracinobacteroides hominis TaxID=2780086 RepID=UPI0018F49A6C|nr:amino acid permease [Sandaracinobacteroides hominis]
MAAGNPRGIGPVMGTLLVATTMIGSGIYMIPATVGAIGSISLLGWIIATLGAMLAGLSIAFLSRIGPPATFIDHIGRHLGPVVGLSSAIFYFVSIILTLPAVAVAVTGYLGFLFPAVLPQPANFWTACAILWLFALLNQLGPRTVAFAGSATLILGLVPILLVGFLGWDYFDPQIFRDSWNISGHSNVSALFQATLLVFMAFIGFEMASLVSNQMRDPDRNIPIATIVGVLIAATVYIASSTVISGMIPAAQLAKSTAPFAAATALIIGPIAGMLIAVAAATKAAGTLGSLQLGTIESYIATMRQAGVRIPPRAIINFGIAIISTIILLLTESPTVAQQFGIIATAATVLCIFVFLLAGLALARATRGLRRAAGLATAALFAILLAGQPVDTLLLSAVALLSTFAFSAFAVARLRAHAFS